MSSNKKAKFLPEPSRNRRGINFKIKQKIISDAESGMKTSDIARKYSLHYSTVNTIIKKKDKILNAISSMPSSHTMITHRIGIRVKMENMLRAWCERQAQTAPLDATTIQNKAQSIFDQLYKDSTSERERRVTFTASRGWYARFRRRCNDLYMTPSETTKKCVTFKDKLRVCINDGGYCDQAVFNVKQIPLFWKMIPKANYEDEPEFKDKLSIILVGNAAGDCKLKPAVVYHSENPEPLKNKSKAGLPVIWKTNPQSAVTASIFEDWYGHHFIPEVERYCLTQNIPFKVLLILQLSPSYPPVTIVDFDPRVRVLYLATDSLSLQPFDNGIVRAFKAVYVRQLLDNMKLSGLDLKSAWKAFNILDCVRAIGESWSEVSKSIINNSWRELCEQFVVGSVISSDELIEDIINDIVKVGKKLGLDVDNQGVIEFLKEDSSIAESVKEEENMEIDTEKKMTAEFLKNALDKINAGIKSIEEMDSNEERVINVKKEVEKSIGCYLDLLQKKESDIELSCDSDPKPSTSHT